MTTQDSYKKIDNDILLVLRNASQPLTKYKIAISANISNPTAVTHLQQMALAGTVSFRDEKGNKPRTVWWLKKKQEDE